MAEDAAAAAPAAEDMPEAPALARQLSAIATHTTESAVVDAPVESVWAALKPLDFSWWSLVDSCTRTSGEENAIDAIYQVVFTDGMNWTIEIRELSSLHRSLTFEVIASEPGMSVTSVVHTISVERVTASNQSFVKWATDFSNDANVEVIQDSKYKRLDAFDSLSSAVDAHK